VVTIYKTGIITYIIGYIPLNITGGDVVLIIILIGQLSIIVVIPLVIRIAVPVIIGLRRLPPDSHGIVVAATIQVVVSSTHRGVLVICTATYCKQQCDSAIFKRFEYHESTLF